jgi:hypothetical protein
MYVEGLRRNGQRSLMASQFSVESGHRIARLLKYYEGPPYNIPEVLDAELQEVREVLVSTARHKDSYGLPCWCVVMMRTMPHMEHCQRARALMEKLEVRP